MAWAKRVFESTSACPEKLIEAPTLAITEGSIDTCSFHPTIIVAAAAQQLVSVG